MAIYFPSIALSLDYVYSFVKVMFHLVKDLSFMLFADFKLIFGSHNWKIPCSKQI